MLPFVWGLLLLLWVVVSILGSGIAVLHRCTPVRGMALVAYGAGAGVLLHALLGLGIALAPALRWSFVAALILFALAGTVYILFRRVLKELSIALSAPAKISLLLWFVLLVIGLGILHLDVRFPESLPDGLYIAKAHTTSVRIQYLTGLPADNYIPFAVSEFILRGVSFKNERPILPANEVTNRTVLMSLVSVPFRVALGAPRDHPQLGTYTYIGRQWPDVWKLDAKYSFDEFAVVGLILNSFLLLGLLMFCSAIGGTSVLPLAALLYVTNAYFISQTIYTWPKPLAGFFILLSWTSIRLRHSPAVVAILMALAYHSHPYAIVFAAFVGLFYLVHSRGEKLRAHSALVYLCVFGLGIMPWIVWTRFILQIPSDLIAQNFAGPGTEAAWASPVNFLWIRLHNLFAMAAPTMFSVYPFDLGAVANYWMFCLPGAVGIVIILPALAQCARLEKPQPWLWYGLLGPACAILAVYSCPALPVLHGYQPLLGVLLFFGVWWLTEHTSRLVCIGFVGIQLVLNVCLVLARGVVVGARFP